MKFYSITLLYLLFTAILYGQTNHGTISGEVRDAVTKQPLPGANVVISGTSLGASANERGYFVITNVPAGTYAVKASMIGSDPVTKTDITVRPQRNTSISFGLPSSSVEMSAVEVESDYFARPSETVVSMRTLAPEEIRRSPGSAEDIFRVMQSMPGVATAGGKSAQLIVRGGNPDENLTLLDNIEIYNPIHFARSGESMGIISIVNPALLEKVDFLTGGFPAKYGDKMSSVFDMTLQDGNRELYNTDVNLNIAGFGAMVDGPLADNSTMIFSIRRGFFDVLTSIMDRPAAPRYYDAVGKVTIDLNREHRISLIGFYYIDQIDREGSTRESSAMSKYEYLARDDYGSAFGVNWRALLSPSAFLLTTLSTTSNGWTTSQGTAVNRALRGEEIVENETTLRSEVTYQFSPALNVTVGVLAKGIDSRNNSWTPPDTTRNGTLIPATTISYQPDLTAKAGLFVQSTYTIAPPLTVSAGLRFDRFALINQNDVSPRLSASYMLTPEVKINAAWGKFVQTPASYQISPDPRNLSLNSSKAIHYIAGIEHLLRDDTRATVELYYKDIHDVIVDPDSSNLLVNSGSGFARGIEFSLQRKFTGGFVGSASYSYSISRRKDHVLSPEYDFEYDRPHIVNLLFGMEIAEGWQIGAKFQYASGNPYTPVTGTVLKGGVYYLVDGPVNSVRYPDYHKLDVRVDRQFIFSGWSLTAYLDLWNVYNRDNIMSYSFKADASGAITRSTRYDFGITPIAGISAKF